MKVVVTSNGADLDATSSLVFGRCPVYVFVDTDTMEFEAVQNPALAAPGGAGIQAAQFVVEHGAQVVLSGNVGPNAYSVLQAAGIPVFLSGGGTVREVVQAYLAGSLQQLGGANVAAHAGMGTAVGGVGMGRGMGRGMGMGRGARTVPAASPADMAGPEVVDELGALRQEADRLSKQLADVTRRLEELSGKD